MSAEQAAELIIDLEVQGAHPVVGGGWAVDALLGEQTRPHSDLDLWLPAVELYLLLMTLAARDLNRVLPVPGDRPWNFVLHDGRQLRVDLHLFEPRRDGTWHYGSALAGDVFPDSALQGGGTIAGVPVRCDAPEWSVRWHTGYQPRETDRHDVLALCHRFDIMPPAGFR
jgi:lincosamide nucleotidyltransferase A/C/D/E